MCPATGVVELLDRLITHEMKTGPAGVPYYDRDKIKPELPKT
jgi:hypothetical protein